MPKYTDMITCECSHLTTIDDNELFCELSHVIIVIKEDYRQYYWIQKKKLINNVNRNCNKPSISHCEYRDI